MLQDEFELWHPEFGAWFRRICINQQTMRGIVWPGLIIHTPESIGKTICLCYGEHFVSQNISSSCLYVDEHILFSSLSKIEGTAQYYESLKRISNVEWLFYDNLLDSDHSAHFSFAYDALDYIIRSRADNYLPTFFSSSKSFSEIQEKVPSSIGMCLSELKRITLYRSKFPKEANDHLISKHSCIKTEAVV